MKVMKKHVKLLVMASIVFLLAGCMYPEDDSASQETPYADQLEFIQKAVEAYQKDTGGLLADQDP